MASGLASVLDLPVIDRDTPFDWLFDSKDAAGRARQRILSGQSDAMFEGHAQVSKGAILVSFWQLPGMPSGSGTPTAWLSELGGSIVNVHCVCQPETAAERFLRSRCRQGQLNTQRSYEDVLKAMREKACPGPLKIGWRIEVNTEEQLSLEALASDVDALLSRQAAS